MPERTMGTLFLPSDLPRGLAATPPFYLHSLGVSHAETVATEETGAEKFHFPSQEVLTPVFAS